MNAMADPSSEQRTDDVDADVLIVGLGPTGATAAGLLAQQGLRVMASVLLDDLTGSRVRVVAATALKPQEVAEFDSRLAQL